MNWRKTSTYTLESEGYIVSRYQVGGTWKYQAIRKRGSVSLLVADSADECKAACAEDANV